MCPRLPAPLWGYVPTRAHRMQRRGCRAGAESARPESFFRAAASLAVWTPGTAGPRLCPRVRTGLFHGSVGRGFPARASLCGPRRSPARNTLPAPPPCVLPVCAAHTSAGPVRQLNRRVEGPAGETHTFVRVQTRVAGTRGEAGSQLLRGDTPMTIALPSPRTPPEGERQPFTFSPAPLSAHPPHLWDPDPGGRTPGCTSQRDCGLESEPAGIPESRPGGPWRALRKLDWEREASGVTEPLKTSSTEAGTRAVCAASSSRAEVCDGRRKNLL